MRKQLFGLGLIGILLGSSALLWAQSNDRTIDNPQIMMVGSRLQALGGTNPVVGGDINGILINPAVMGTVDAMPIAISNQRLLNAFEYMVVNGSYPLDVRVPFLIDGKKVTQKFVLGFSYGSVGLSDIPQTETDRGVIRQIDSFSSGFNVYQFGAGTVFYDFLGFNEISFGSSFKLISQTVDSNTRSTWAFDVGTLGTYHINYLFLDKASVGISILNILSSPLVWDDFDATNALPLEFYLGGRLDMFQEQLSVFAHNSPAGESGGGLSIGAEALLADSFYFRGSTNFNTISYGTGLILRNIAGFGAQEYSMRLDYTQSVNEAPFNEEINHMVSFTILGESRPFSPRILFPSDDVLTTQREITLSGIGPKSTTIRIYNNGNLSRTTQSDRFGQWRYENFPLKEGDNSIFLKSYSIERDESIDSDPLLITSDTIPPGVEIEIYPEGDELIVRAVSEDDIDVISGIIEGISFDLESVRENTWEGEVTMPEGIRPGSTIPANLSYLQLTAVDKAGNEAFFEGEPFFVELSYPQDQLVHFKDSVRLIGLASPMVKSMTVNGYAVYIDPDDRFSINLPLEPGKNAVTMALKTLNDEDIDYKLRVLYLKTYEDLDRNVSGRREIEFMSTLGLLEGDSDGFFRPDAPVTRKYLAKVMVKELNIPLDEDPGDVLEIPSDDPDVAYIKAAIEDGLLFAYPDGTFRPDDPLTFGEAFSLMGSAGVIGPEDPEDPDLILTRKDLAKYLAYQPKYEIKIERLIDWERGFD